MGNLACLDKWYGDNNAFSPINVARSRLTIITHSVKYSSAILERLSGERLGLCIHSNLVHMELGPLSRWLSTIHSCR